jgi:DnaJ-class molecular chaperone
VAERDERIAAAPLETCIWCDGLGVWEQSERQCPCHGSQDQCITCKGTGIYEKRQCPLCAGQRKRKPLDAGYFLTVDGVREFAAFVLASGGFEIW